MAQVQFLINAGGDVNQAAIVDNNLTSLHSAVSRDGIDVVRALINAGADTEKTAKGCLTAISIAASCNNFKMVKFIYENALEAEADVRDGFVQAKSYAQNSPEILKFLKRPSPESQNKREIMLHAKPQR